MLNELASSVRTEIGREPHLIGSQLTVEVLNHDNTTIVLRGCVATYFQKQMAQETARKVIKRLDVSFSIANEIEVARRKTEG